MADPAGAECCLPGRSSHCRQWPICVSAAVLCHEMYWHCLLSPGHITAASQAISGRGSCLWPPGGHFTSMPITSTGLVFASCGSSVAADDCTEHWQACTLDVIAAAAWLAYAAQGPVEMPKCFCTEAPLGCLFDLTTTIMLTAGTGAKAMPVGIQLASCWIPV